MFPWINGGLYEQQAHYVDLSQNQHQYSNNHAKLMTIKMFIRIKISNLCIDGIIIYFIIALLVDRTLYDISQYLYLSLIFYLMKEILSCILLFHVLYASYFHDFRINSLLIYSHIAPNFYLLDEQYSSAYSYELGILN